MSVGISLTKDMKKMIDSMIDQGAKDLEDTFVRTGNAGFDIAISDGKGLPMGSSILLWAAPGCGKTTLIGDVCKRLLDAHAGDEDPFKIMYIDSERSKQLLLDIGLGHYMKSGNFVYMGDAQLTWRTIESLYSAALQDYGKAKGTKLIIIDSLTNIQSDASASLDKSCADGDFGTKARERSNFYGKFLPLCSAKGISSIFISQARQKQGATQYEDQKKAAVSYADLHNVEVIVKCGRKSDKVNASKVSYSTYSGVIEAENKYIMTLDSSKGDAKNRFWNGFPSEILIVKGKGADNTFVIRKLLELNKYIKKDGGWYSFNSAVAETLNLPNGKLRLKAIENYVRENEQILTDLLKEKDQYRNFLEPVIVESDEDEDE